MVMELTNKLLVILRMLVVTLFALVEALIQKLWRRLRGRLPSHESPKLELPRFERKMQHLARLMSSTQSQVTFILETRNSRIIANELTNHFLISDSFVVPAMRLAFLVAFGRRGLIGLSGGGLSGSHYYVLACVVQKSNVSSFNLVCVCVR